MEDREKREFGLTERDIGIEKFLTEGDGFTATLKQKEEDFIVRELETNGKPLGFFEEFLYDVETLNLLLKLPFVTEESIDLVIDAMKGVKIENKLKTEVGRLENIEDKDLRSKIHFLYSLHPHMFTTTEEGSNTIKVFHAPGHRKNIYTMTVIKRGKDTVEVASLFAKILKTIPRNIQFSGNKDRKGITIQKMSIQECSFASVCSLYRTLRKRENNEAKTSGEYSFSQPIYGIDKHSILTLSAKRPRVVSDEEKIMQIHSLVEQLHEEVEDRQAKTCRVVEDNTAKGIRKVGTVLISSVRRTVKPLQLGELGGNNFIVTLRNVKGDPLRVKEAIEMGRRGFLNYYGTQRFGRNFFNPVIGEALLNENYDQAVSLIMENARHSISEKAVQAMERYSMGRYREAAETWPLRFVTEKIISRGKEMGKSNEEIISSFRRESRMLYIHSHQSMVFNRELSRRVEGGMEVWDEDFVGVNAKGMSSITSDIDYHIRKAGDEKNSYCINDVFIQLEPKDESEVRRNSPRGGFRRAVVQPEDLAYTIRESENGSEVEMTFTLPPGTYATMFVREISKGGCVTEE